MEIYLESQAVVAREATKFLLIGKIISDKPVNRRGAMGVLRSMWPSRDCPVITELGSQTYGLAFNSEDLMLQAMIDSPWNVMGFCLILKKWEVEKSISEIPFHKVQYWIQIHGLPLEMQNLNNIKKIGSTIGSIIILEKPEWNQGKGRCYMRDRIEIDARKPLLPGFWVPRIDVSDLPRDNVYGPWLKAAPVRSTMDDRMIFVDEHGVPELPMIGTVVEDGKLVHYPSVLEPVEKSILVRAVARESDNPGEFSNSQARGGILGDNQGACGWEQAFGKEGQACRRVGLDFEASGSCSHSMKGRCTTSADLESGFVGGEHVDILAQSGREKNALIVESSSSLPKEYLLENLVTNSTSEVIVNSVASPLKYIVEPQLADPSMRINAISRESLYHVDIGLVSYFRNLNLKRSFNDAMKQNEYSSKRVWAEGQNGAMIKFISEERCYSEEVNIEKEAATDIKSERVILGRRRRTSTMLAGGSRLKEIPVMANVAYLMALQCSEALTVQALKELKRKNDPQLFYIMETKNKRSYMKGLKRKLKFSHDFYVDPDGLSGGLALWWTDDVKVKILRSCKNLIDTSVIDVKNGNVSRVFWVYGPPESDERNKIWHLVQRRMEDQGQKFTWIGKRDEMIIKERLDRALVNTEWLEKVPRSFKFEIMWTEKEECEQVIRDGWSSEFQGSKAYILVQKQHRCRKALLDWSRKEVAIYSGEIGNFDVDFGLEDGRSGLCTSKESCRARS
ncbi:hypothetical protein CCACVL1_23233 [Corchorus capsularis]|uniref:Uncharacterized protein n=1 Tax=Corchorus capsularis TaxID=210143 RepID=A0A1R3GUR9_COCAP|nr:hypothetical protein CCACVL1_23233 [Corchorus capsularis]